MECKKRTKALFILQLVLTVLWLTNLKNTDSYFSVYCLCGAASLYCAFESGDRQFPLGKKALILGILAAALLALAPVLANYPLFERVRNPSEVSAGANRLMNILETGVTFLSGMWIFWQILKYFVIRSCEKTTTAFHGTHPLRFFFLTSSVILVINLSYLFLVAYPGNLCYDCMVQFHQISTGVYTNFTPFWNTQLLRVITELGYRLFGTPNAASAAFCAFQILLMALIFGYSMMTLYQLGVPRFWLGISFSMYAFLPYNIAFSASIWKDVPFSLGLLLVLTSMCRVLRNLDPHSLGNKILLILGGMLTVISRTNGWHVLAFSFLIFAVVLRKQMKPLMVPWLIVVVLGWAMTGPFLDAMNIDRITAAEGMAVPIQQVSALVVKNGNMTEEERALLDTYINTEEIPDKFMDISADGCKDLVTEKLVKNKLDFMKLWLKLGLKNPEIYLKTWVNLTKGYWNGGYDYYVYAEYIPENDYGFYTDVSRGPVFQLSKAYFNFSRETILFEPLLSIGLMVWLTFLTFYLNLIHRRRETVLLVPLLILIIGLWLGAPVYSEFRYLYPLFTAFPLLFPITLYRENP